MTKHIANPNSLLATSPKGQATQAPDSLPPIVEMVSAPIAAVASPPAMTASPVADLSPLSVRKAELLAIMKAEQEAVELEDLERELEALRAKRADGQATLEAAKLTTQRAREAAQTAGAEYSLELEQSKQRIAQLENVPESAKLTEEELEAIKRERVNLAVDRKNGFLSTLKASNNVERQAMQATTKKFKAQAENRLFKLEQEIPTLLSLSGTPQPGDTVTLKSAEDQTIEATVV